MFRPRLELCVISSIDEVTAEDWNALLCAGDSPFVEWSWLYCLEKSGSVGVESGWIPQHVLIYEHPNAALEHRSKKRLIAAAPAYLKTNSDGEFVFDWSWAEAARRMGDRYYPKLVFGVPFTPVGGARVLCADPSRRREMIEFIANFAQKKAIHSNLSSVHTLFPLEAETTIWSQQGYIPRVGIQYQFDNRGFTSFEHFLTSFPSKKRTQLRRERKEIRKMNLVIRTLEEDELNEHSADQMYAFYINTADKFLYGNRYLTRSFFFLVCEHFSKRLRWAFAEDHRRPIAGAFNVEKDGVLYGRYWGSEIEIPFLHFNVCYYHGIEECILHRWSRFEPGAGGEHKRVRGFSPQKTYSAHFLKNAGLREAVQVFLEHETKNIDRYLGLVKT